MLKKSEIYSITCMIIFVILFHVEAKSTFTFFIKNYWLYALVSMLILEIIVLYHIKKNIDRYGLISFFAVLFLIPLLTFFTIPKFCHFLDIVPTKNVVIEGYIQKKYYIRHAEDPFIDIKPTNMPIETINTTIEPQEYNGLTVNQRVKVQGTLSMFGFNYHWIVK